MELKYSVFILHLKYLKLTFKVTFLYCKFETFMNTI